jgi:hypothetical protein
LCCRCGKLSFVDIILAIADMQLIPPEGRFCFVFFLTFAFCSFAAVCPGLLVPRQAALKLTSVTFWLSVYQDAQKIRQNASCAAYF